MTHNATAVLKSGLGRQLASRAEEQKIAFLGNNLPILGTRWFYATYRAKVEILI